MTAEAASAPVPRTPHAPRAQAWQRLVQDRYENAKRRTIFALVSGLVGALLFFEVATLLWCLAVMAAYPVDRRVWRSARDGRLTETSAALRTWVFVQSSLVCSLGPMLWFTGGEAGKILAAFYVSAGLLNALTTFKPNGPLLLIGVFTPLLQMTLLPIAAFALAGEARTAEMLYPILGPLVFAAFCASIWKGLVEGEKSRIAEHSATIAELERAEEEGDTRSRLFQLVERELRAPLQALSAAARRVSAASLPPEVRSQARTVEDAAAVMSAVLTDLQALSTLQAGGLRITPTATDPAALVTALAEAWRTVARDKWLELFVDISPNVPANVAVDAVRVSQVVHHLLANAVRFTRQGGVRLRLEASAAEGPEIMLAFTVADTGPGMAADRLTALLAPGDRLSRAADRGFGLSLALCATVAEAMGGRLQARSIEGQGTVFSLVAPVRVLAVDEILAAPAPADRAEPLSLKVLIVDDSAATRRLATVFLQEAGCRAVTASSGPQALQALQQETFDAIITDLRMPGMDGLSFARAVRAAPERYGGAPIVAFSADHDQWDAAAVRAAGVQGFLAKPFTPSSLLSALEEAIAAAAGVQTAAA